jgi:hypothetical protein
MLRRDALLQTDKPNKKSPQAIAGIFFVYVMHLLTTGLSVIALRMPKA